MCVLAAEMNPNATFTSVRETLVNFCERVCLRQHESKLAGTRTPGCYTYTLKFDVLLQAV
jgi:hypothetical protein